MDQRCTDRPELIPDTPTRTPVQSTIPTSHKTIDELFGRVEHFAFDLTIGAVERETALTTRTGRDQHFALITYYTFVGFCTCILNDSRDLKADRYDL